MPNSIEAKVVSGLMAHFTGISLPSGATVAWPNTNFTPPPDKPYVRISIAKNQPINRHIGGGKEPERIGLFMAVVCWPVGQGIVAPSELAATIRDRFAFNTKIDFDGIRIWIDDEPRVAGDEQGSVCCEIPVIVPFHVYP